MMHIYDYEPYIIASMYTVCTNSHIYTQDVVFTNRHILYYTFAIKNKNAKISCVHMHVLL